MGRNIHMDPRRTNDDASGDQSQDWHKRFRQVIAGAFLIGLIVSPAGRSAVDLFMRHSPAAGCTHLETAMNEAIDRYKYDDSARFDIERRRIEARHDELSCSFSTYSMYTLENRL